MANKSGKAGRTIANNIYVRLQGAARLLLYLLLAGMLLVIEVMLVAFIHVLLSLYDSRAADVSMYVGTALGAVSFLPIFSRLRWLLDNRLYHDTYELSDVLQDYSQQFGSLGDQESITRFLLDGLATTINLAAIAYVALQRDSMRAS